MMRMIRKTLFALTIVLSSVILFGCKDSATSQQVKTTVVEAKAKAVVTPLDFKGTLEPIRQVSLASPVDGRIARLYFAYGNAVKKGQKIVSINSKALLTLLPEYPTFKVVPNLL